MSATINHLGTATLVLDIGGTRVVTDPVLDGAGTRHRLGLTIEYSHIAGEPVPSELVAGAELVLLSHDNHRDNLDAGGLALCRSAKRVVTHAAGAQRLRKRGIDAVALEPGAHLTHRLATGEELRITAIPARHGPLGTEWLTGPVLGFMLEAAALPGPLYVTGDTRWFSGLGRWWSERPAPHTVVAHAGAATFRGLRFSMDARELAQLAAVLKPTQLIPIHYEEWSHFQEGRSALEAGLRERRVQNVRWLPLRSSSAL
jgi:L-ascorbate metabolism protein UlaG (beta-lactamase superfamily)